MQRALERSNPHRRLIAEMTNGINMDYIKSIRNKEPPRFGGLKDELIGKMQGGMIVKNSSYQGDVIKQFSIKNNMPKPDMHFNPDNLAVGKPIRFNASMPKAVASEYQAVKDMGKMEANEEYEKVKDDDYDLSRLFGSGRRPIGLPKPRTVGGKRNSKIKKLKKTK